MIISGNLLEVGVKNANGWGIPLEDAQDILSSLPGLPLKICKYRAHACDYKPKTEAETSIGKIISASRKNNMINVTAEVTGENEKHIRTGKYPRQWSIFTGYRNKDQNGYLTGVKPLSVSLVEYPAYPGAGYSIVPDISHGAAAVAAAQENLSELDRYYLQKVSYLESKLRKEAAATIDYELSELDKYYLKKQEGQAQQPQKEDEKVRKQPAISLQEAIEKLNSKFSRR